MSDKWPEKGTIVPNPEGFKGAALSTGASWLLIASVWCMLKDNRSNPVVCHSRSERAYCKALVNRGYGISSDNYGWKGGRNRKMLYTPNSAGVAAVALVCPEDIANDLVSLVWKSAAR